MDISTDWVCEIAKDAFGKRVHTKLACTFLPSVAIIQLLDD
jgi:hypothetical protein